MPYNYTRFKGKCKAKPLMSRTFRLLILIPLLWLALALRVHLLGDAPVWWDEGWTVWLIRHPLAAVSPLAARDVHPPLYFLLLWPWRRLAGESAFALRYFSVAAGVLSVALVYRLGTDWLGHQTGLLAALFTALARFSVWWSQEMRMYTLATVFGLLTLHFAVRWYRRDDRRYAVGYVLCTVVNLYTFYLTALFLLVANLWVGLMIWRRPQRRAFLIRWTAGQLAALVLFAPWLRITLHGRGSWSVAAPFDPLAFLRLFWTLVTVGAPTELSRWAVTASVLLALFLVGLLARRHEIRRSGDVVALLALAILVPPAVVYVLTTTPLLRFLYAPQVQARYLFLLLPAYHLLFAWGLTAWPVRHPQRPALLRNIVASGLTAVAILLLLPGLTDYYTARWPVDRYRSVADTLHAFRLPDEPVLLHTDRDWPVFIYDAALADDEWIGIPYGVQVTEPDAEDRLEPLWSRATGVWLVTNRDALRVDPHERIAHWLADHAAWQREFRYGLATLTFYAHDPQRPRPPRLPTESARPQMRLRPAARFSTQEGSWTVWGFDLPIRRARAGDTIALALYWQAGEEERLFRLGLRGNGNRWVDLNRWTGKAETAGVLLRTQHELTLPPELRAGRYTLVLSSADRQVKLAQITVGSPPATLGEVAVTPATPLRVRFGPALWLVGYDLPKVDVSPGETIPLTLYWEARGKVPGRYKVFVHLLGQVYNADQQNFLWGQVDVEPLRGTPPLTAWPLNRTLADHYALPVLPNAPAGDYRIEVGLYDPFTGARLPAFDAEGNSLGGRLLLSEVRVAPGLSGPE
jgi:4-amino-4-deoxy-L-arabinose transferase-like glycosyltransferase